MKSYIIILLVFFVFTGTVFCEKLATLTGVLNPREILLDDHQIYITENTSIYIYSLTDFQLKKKFGKAGEGPQEFMDFVFITLQPDHLLINSTGKVSYYKKDGTFIRELKSPGGMGNNFFLPLKEGFIGVSGLEEDQVLYNAIHYYDSNLAKGKEIFRIKAAVQSPEKIRLLKQTFDYQTYDNKLFIIGKEGFIIDVVDHTGKQLFSIEQKYQRRKFTADDEKTFREAFKARYKARYEALKNRLIFPGYYPAIWFFMIRDNKIFVATWKTENEKVEFFIFDMKGKLVKRLFIPIVFSGPVGLYPFDIHNGKLYQLIENENEEWELHTDEIN